jgi:serine protease Do
MLRNIPKGLTGLFAVALFSAVAWAQAPDHSVAPRDGTPHKMLGARHSKFPPASYLGIEPRDVTPDRVSELKLRQSRGVEVMMVDRDSPAGKAGLKEHDVITGFNGKPISTADQLRHLLRNTQPGSTVSVAVIRAGQPVSYNLTLAQRPDENAMMPVIPNIPPIPPIDIDVPRIIVLQSAARNGAVVEDLTPQLAEFFGVRNGQGVLVRSVDRGSPAAVAGLKAGDVIVKVGNEAVSCSSEWRRMMHDRNGSVPLAVVRDKHEQSVTIKLPDKSSDSSLNFDFPRFDKEMRGLQAQLDKMKPEMQRQFELAQVEAQKELDAHRGEIEQAGAQAQKELETHRGEIEQAMRNMQLSHQDWERIQQQAHDAMEKAMRELNSN